MHIRPTFLTQSSTFCVANKQLKPAQTLFFLHLIVEQTHAAHCKHTHGCILSEFQLSVMEGVFLSISAWM